MHNVYRTLSTLVLLLGAALLGACSSTTSLNNDSKEFKDILEYHTTLDENHRDLTHSVFFLSDDIRQMVRQDFDLSSRHQSTRKLARWLTDADGHNMIYDIDANLTPAQAFNDRRANCLSFSLLLIEMASELGITLELNQVDLPDIWGEDESEDLVFYRHVNVIYKSTRKTQIFDLALEDYRSGFPQRIISRHHGMGLLFSNLGIQQLQKGNAEQALHYLKLSVSIFPENADMWINLGAAFKRAGNLTMAEKIYLKAFSIRDDNSLAASNLERIYRRQGKLAKANRFEKYAKRARLNNPYLQYRIAQKAYDDGSYKTARKAIKRAIRLHDKDPKFYELSSRIKQLKHKYVAALKDINRAHELSTEALQRGRYVKKAERLVARAKEHALLKSSHRKQDIDNKAVNIDSYRRSSQPF